MGLHRELDALKASYLQRETGHQAGDEVKRLMGKMEGLKLESRPSLSRPAYSPEQLNEGQGEFLAALDERHREVELHPERFRALPWAMDSYPSTGEGSGLFGMYPSRRVIRGLLMRELRRLIEWRRGAYISRAENEAVLDYLVGYICEPQRHHPSLIISSGVGTGKTTLTHALFRVMQQSPRVVELKEQKDRSRLLNIIEANQLAIGFDPEDFATRRGDLYRVWTSGLLIIDDLGLEQLSIKHYGTEYRPIEMLIGMRYNQMLPTIISTNLTRKEMETRYGSRVFDRMCELYRFIYLSQSSFRSEIGRQYGSMQ